MKNILFILLVILLSTIVIAEEAPVNNQISWSDFFYKAPERIFLEDDSLNSLTIRKPYNLEMNGENHYFKISSLAVSSVELAFYDLPSSIFLYEGVDTEINVKNSKATAHLSYVEGEAAIIKFTKYVPPPVIPVENFPLIPEDVVIDDTVSDVVENSTEINDLETEFQLNMGWLYAILIIMLISLIVSLAIGGLIIYKSYSDHSKLPPVLGKPLTKKSAKEIISDKKIKKEEPVSVEEPKINHKNIFTYNEYEKLKEQLDNEHKEKSKK